MRRRDVLKTVGLASITGGVAGCTQTIAGDNPSPGSPTETPDGTSTPTAEPVPVAVVDVSGFGDSYPVTFDVELEAARFVGMPRDLGDGAHPAIVRVTLANTGTDDRSLWTGHREVFATTRSDDKRYTLVDHERRVESDILDASCWKLSDHLAYPGVMRATELAAGESKSVTLAVLTHTDAAGCLPTGETTFTETYSERSEDDTADENTFSGGFTLDIGEN